MAGQVITKVNANSGTHLISTSFYGTCSTAAGTAAKAVIVNDSNITDAITLVNGMTLTVKFINSNSVANPTITVYNNSGTAAAPTQGSTTLIAAKSIYQVNTNLNAAGTAASTTAATSWKAGAIVVFVYDGQGWVEVSSTYNQDNDTTALTSMTGTLTVDHGGTGVTSNTINSVLVGGTTTTGAIQNVAAASGALYSTGANIKPTFGTLPIAQGGTGESTATEAWTALGGGNIGKKNTLSTSDIPSLDYLPLSGGTLTGDVTSTANFTAISFNGFRGRSNLASTDNIDTLFTTGIYYVGGNSVGGTLPSDITVYFSLITMGGGAEESSTYVGKQMILGGSGVVWTRSYSGSPRVWSAWTQLVFDSVAVGTPTITNATATTFETRRQGNVVNLSVYQLKLSAALTNGNSVSLGTGIIGSNARPTNVVYLPLVANVAGFGSGVLMSIGTGGNVTVYNRSGSSLGTGVNLMGNTSWVI